MINGISKGWLLRLAACLVLVGCGDDTSKSLAGSDLVQARQGLSGTVEFWQGNFMPVVDPANPGGSVSPVVRKIYIHEAATRDDVVRDGYGGFYSEVNTAWAATVTSDSLGRFSAELSAGTYSIFVWEQERYYANGSSGGYINPVTVPVGTMVQVQVKIDYQATY